MAALQIIALDTTTPRLRAPASGDTYSAPRAVDITPESLTGSAATSSLSIAQTWNTTGTPTAIDLNVTDTASNASSLLMNLRVGGASRFSVSKAGQFSVGQTGSGQGQLSTSAGIVNFVTNFTTTFSAGQVFLNGTNQYTVQVGGVLCIGQTGTSADLIILRDAANTLAQRNGVNAQAFRWYQSFTDASNYTRGQVSAASGIVTLSGESAGTGAANIDVAITPKGTGRVRYGTHSAIGAETVTGYIEIKDEGGTVRKLAVVS